MGAFPMSSSTSSATMKPMESQKWNQGPKWIPVVVQEINRLILLEAELENGPT